MEGDRRRRLNPPLMETNVNRTLVKSAPELWELADDDIGWNLDGAADRGRPGPAIEMRDREPESMLAWQTAGETRSAGSRSS